jgi:DNA-binding winged helix-turn-helix (wHTH) protein
LIKDLSDLYRRLIDELLEKGMPRKEKRCYEFGSFRFDLNARILMRDSEIIPLTPKALDTLLFLVRRCGELVSRNELVAAVWPDVCVEENNLNSNIFMLRRAFGDENYISTIPRRGYRFMANVREIMVEMENEQGDDLPKISVLPAQRPEPTSRYLAILPFKTLSHDEGSLGLGLADALITRLSNQQGVVVRPTSASAKYRGIDQEPILAGRELGVGMILEGCIQLSGDRIRITVQLVNVAEGISFWAEKFDDRFTDVFEVEDKISARIADALIARLCNEDDCDWNSCAAA